MPNYRLFLTALLQITRRLHSIIFFRGSSSYVRCLPSEGAREVNPSPYVFRKCDLFVIHTEFPFKFDARKPHVSRMDAVCSICVAFLWESSSSRGDGAAHFFFNDGLLIVDGRMRDAFPEGRRAAHATSFIEVLGRFPTGVFFQPHGPTGSVGSVFREIVRPDSLYLVLDDGGSPLNTRGDCDLEGLRKCPDDVVFVIGGTRGFIPYTPSAICGFLGHAGALHSQMVAIGRTQKHASQIVDYLRSMNDVYDLRNACALTFYSGEILDAGVIL